MNRPSEKPNARAGDRAGQQAHGRRQQRRQVGRNAEDRNCETAVSWKIPPIRHSKAEADDGVRRPDHLWTP
jgi:hypothetical protein